MRLLFTLVTALTWCALFSLTLGVSPVRAQTVHEIRGSLQSNQRDGFGRAVGAWTDHVVVGADEFTQGDTLNAGSVSAYDFRENTSEWTLQRRYPGKAAKDHLGVAVALDSTSMVACSRKGSCRLFSRASPFSLWKEQGVRFEPIITAWEGVDFPYHSVALWGDTLLIHSVSLKQEVVVNLYTKSGDTWAQEPQDHLIR